MLIFQLAWRDSETRQKRVLHAVLDTLVWQGLASVVIPGITINRFCYITGRVLAATTSLPPGVRMWTTTALGLAAIPFIIKPIDNSVDYMMNHTVRKWYHIKSIEQKLVHHQRDD